MATMKRQPVMDVDHTMRDESMLDSGEESDVMDNIVFNRPSKYRQLINSSKQVTLSSSYEENVQRQGVHCLLLYASWCVCHTFASHARAHLIDFHCSTKAISTKEQRHHAPSPPSPSLSNNPVTIILLSATVPIPIPVRVPIRATDSQRRTNGNVPGARAGHGGKPRTHRLQHGGCRVTFGSAHGQ
jgi:hypothetical protein